MARVTVEDCLEKAPNRFALVHLSAKRALQLKKDAEPLVETDNKEIVTSLREIAAQRVQYQEKIIQEFDPAAEAEIRRAAQIRNYEGKVFEYPEPQPAGAKRSALAEASASSASLACSTMPSNFCSVRMARRTLTGLPMRMALASVGPAVMAANLS